MINVTDNDVKNMPMILRHHVEVSTTAGIEGKTIHSFLVKHEHDKFVTYQVYEEMVNGDLEMWGEEWFHSIEEAMKWFKEADVEAQWTTPFYNPKS